MTFQNLIRLNSRLSIEHKILNAVSILGIGLTITAAIMNYLCALSPITYIFPAICVIIFSLLFTYSLVARNFKVFYHLSYLFIILIFVPVFWFLSSGSNGGFQYFIYVLLVFIVVTSKINQTIYYSSLFLLVNIGLLIVENNHPDWVVPYPSDTVRFVDLIISIPLAFVIIYTILKIFMSIYREAIDKEEGQNNELIEKNNQIEQQKNELEIVNSDKNKLFKVLAHDLRGPFNSILGLSEMLIEDYDELDDKQIKEELGLIQKSAKNTFQLLNDLFTWARTQQEGVIFMPLSFDLSPIVYHVFMQLHQQIVDKDIEVDHSIPDNTFVFADYEMFKIIFRNLISNAIKYTSSKGRIHISCKTSANELIVFITDNGIGMSKATMDSLFKIGEVRSVKGTAGELGSGFGLQICKEFVERHGGKLKVESQLNEGSTFSFSVPIKQTTNEVKYY